MKRNKLNRIDGDREKDEHHKKSEQQKMIVATILAH